MASSSLSELIAACGDSFEYLARRPVDLTDKVFWYAYAYDLEDGGEGVSAEEAVANLLKMIRAKQRAA